MVMPVYKNIGFMQQSNFPSSTASEEGGNIVYASESSRGESVSAGWSFSLKGKPLSYLRIKEIPGKFSLRNEVVLNVSLESGWYCLESEFLHIKVTNSDIQKALEDFHDYFCFDYENYVLEDNGSLSQDAIELKNRYLQLVS